MTDEKKIPSEKPQAETEKPPVARQQDGKSAPEDKPKTTHEKPDGRSDQGYRHD